MQEAIERYRPMLGLHAHIHESRGIYKTVTINLDRILSFTTGLSIPEEDRRIATDRIRELRKIIDEAPKSFRWMMRAQIGEKIRWFELPETG